MKRTLCIALCLVLALALSLGALAVHDGVSVSRGLIRLHVVARDGSEEALSDKLAVRDALLERMGDADYASAMDARRALSDRLPELQALADETLRARGCADPVAVTLGKRFLPEKSYDGFALPAGRYETLYVAIGAAEGSNWWCVLFPPLCLVPASAVEDTARAGGVSPGAFRLMTGKGGEVRFRFKLLEIFANLFKKG